MGIVVLLFAFSIYQLCLWVKCLKKKKIPKEKWTPLNT